MRVARIIIELFGTVSIVSLLVFFVVSFITFTPDAQESAHRLMTVTGMATILGAIVVFTASLLVVPLAENHEGGIARALRTKGFWLSLPQLIVAVLFVAAGISGAWDLVQASSR